MIRVQLLYPRDHIFGKELRLPNWDVLFSDLGLGTLIETMSGNDKFARMVVTDVLSKLEFDPHVIEYRQATVRDAIRNEEILSRIYEIPVKVKEIKKKNWLGILGVKTPSNVVSGSRAYLEILIDGLVELRNIALRERGNFESEGFRDLFGTLEREITDDYIAIVRAHLDKLRFTSGVRISASLGPGCELADLQLVTKKDLGRKKIFSRTKQLTNRLNPRDDAGARFLEELKNMSLQRVAQVLDCATKSLETFFERLQYELAFYLSATRLFRTLDGLGLPVCFPTPLVESSELEIFGLYDPTLAVLKRRSVVQNSVSHRGKNLYFVMGANRGGKTTFLRSIGLAQLMMQVGLFVSASSARIPVASGIFTHFRKSEDKTLERGKFEEELQRMNDIVRALRSGSLLLMNESFSSTNEYEASEVAYEILRALRDSGVRTFYVTHMHGLATKFLEDPAVAFMVAERLENGERTFRILEGRPVNTSHAVELYRKLMLEGSAGVLPRRSCDS